MILKDFFSQFDIRFSDTGFHRFKNPFDVSKNKNMVVNFDQDFVQDWKTGYKKSIAGFISDFLGIGYIDATELVGVIDRPLQLKIPKETLSGVSLPPSVSLFNDCIMADRARAYLKERKLDLGILDDKGWCVGMEGVWLGRIIIPFKIKGQLKYYIGRNFIGSEPKYQNPLSSDVGVGKSELFYNQDALVTKPEGCLVEGAIDAETIGDSAIASLGWKLSKAQISLIVNSRWKSLHIVPDKGFHDKAKATALYFTPYMDVYIHKVAEPFKDINEAGLGNLIISQKKV